MTITPQDILYAIIIVPLAGILLGGLYIIIGMMLEVLFDIRILK